MRELGILFGNTSFATATTLAAFFLGISAGGAAFGRRAARVARPLRAYGWLEAGVAGSALLYFALLEAFHAVYAPLFSALGNSPTLFVAVKFALAMAVLFPPAFFMGGTLPLMSQHLVRRADALGATASRLYAVNTLGAALGAYLAAFHLVRHLGVTGSYAVAVVTTAAVAALALWLGREPTPPAPAAASPRTGPTPPSAGSPPAEPGLAPSAVGALAFFSGAATLALEVLWTRMFAQVLQNSVYTFALILVTFLVSLALGAAGAAALAARGSPPRRVLAILLVGAGVLVALTPSVFLWQAGGLDYLASESGFAAYLLRVFGAAALVLLLPTAWLGLFFPYLIKVAEPWGWGAGRTVGTLAALNTLGGVVGSLLAGFVLLGTFGLWESLRLVAAGYLLLALGLALCRPRQLVPAGLATASALALGLAYVPADLPLVSVDPGRGERVVEVLEGSAATVAVVKRPGSLRIKLNNHYGLGGSGDRAQEAREAHLPLALHPDPKSVFLLGLGTGITAGAVLQHPVERVVATELVPAVVEASRRHFEPWLHGLFSDPRAEVWVEDGRNALAGTRERFDVIIADLFLPWKAGTGSLYAQELYEAGRDRLAPGGLYAQWLLLIQLSEEEFGSIARTFCEVFPRVTLWRGNYRTTHPLVLLVGERDPAPLDASAVETRLRAIVRTEGDQPTKGVGRNAAPDTLEELLLQYQGSLSAARAMLEDHPLNSDDRPFIEYSAPVTHRRKRTGDARAFRGSELVSFYDATFEALPPEGDPFLAQLSAAQRTLPRAGLDLYRAAVARASGDSEGYARAMQRYRDATAETPPDRPTAETPSEPPATDVPTS